METNLLANSKVFLKKNVSTILTCIGGVGVVTSTVMAAKATPKALRRLEQAEEVKGGDLTNLEKIQVAGPAYIPTILVCTSTLVCVFGANILNKRQQAALVSAYAFLDNTYKDYKKKANELYGEEADNHIREELSKDKYEESDIPEDDGQQLFFDEFSGRFFRSTLEKVQRAEYRLNRDLVMRDWATINEFYELIDLPPVDGGDNIGWSTCMNEQAYWQTWVDFSNLKTVTDDGSEYYILRIYQEPMMDFGDFL